MTEETELANAAITMIITGGLMGALGQGIRSIVGMKKLRDKETAGLTQNFSANRLITSIFIGFVAGSLAAFVASDDRLMLEMTKSTLLGFLVAGYAGTDFIEGFASRFLKSDPAEISNTQVQT